MLFNSLEFIFVFLPLTLAGFAFLTMTGRPRAAVLWLVGASYLFYGWLEPRLVALLIASTAFNYGIGVWIVRLRRGDSNGAARALMWAGVAADLALLGYFKYVNFFVGVAGDIGGASLSIGHIVLPIGISFYTFTQIAFLADAARGEVRSVPFAEYFLFVSYFPHLVAGPIMHHKDMVPQFQEAARHRGLQPDWVAVGLSVFAIGLAKKTLIADSLAPFADGVFTKAAVAAPGFWESWLGALAYTGQIYFDFSAYSDMAVGLSLMLGIRLPLNFNSPYKSASIIDFWNRWHISLSQFLRDYLYIPLGGNRHGPSRRYLNLMITMLLGGLWHGAGWTFILWGGLHGLYLVLNHAIRAVYGPPASRAFLATAGKQAVVFIAVVVAWVLFRSDTLSVAGSMFTGMSGLNGLGVAAGSHALAWVALALAIAFLMPNTYEIFGRFSTVLPNTRSPIGSSRWLCWTRSEIWSLAAGVALAAGILGITASSPFLYFRF